jgi:hypothetical protein
MSNTIKVKTRIILEVEYPINMEFYVSGNIDASLAIERRAVAENPRCILESFWDKGIIKTSVKKV